MKNKLIISLFFCVMTFCAIGQVTVIESFSQFESKYIKKIDNDTSYVVNFWATWCSPCVEELQYFEALNEKYLEKKVKVVLVSLDFKKSLETNLIPFLEKNKIKSEVVLLADNKTYEWIDLIDPNWSGAIPITLFIKGVNKNFYEKKYENLHELEEDLIKIL